ncbi:hypothetical protein ACPESN_02510 [Stutzerimonas marianensis]|uniref:hypothetical protein n=1 Tax=Stutzerimonas marianensis TaxID=2929513 RepID=UPI003C2B118C
MQRPAYLLSTSILIAVAALEFHDLNSESGTRLSNASAQQPLSVDRPAYPAAQTINQVQVSAPAQPQRWVF